MADLRNRLLVQIAPEMTKVWLIGYSLASINHSDAQSG
jgi:hypothetical protein